jgi:hypothetical protein
MPDDDDAIPLSELLEEDEAETAKAPAQTKPAPVPGPRATPAKAPPVQQPALADLEAQITAERAARYRDNQRLQTERDNAIRFAQEAERRGVSTYELYTETQITGVQEQMDALGAQQEGALSDGDFKTVAEINKKLTKLGGQLAILERDKATLAEQRAVMTQQHQRPISPQGGGQPAAPQPPADPLERAIMNRTEPTKAFLRKHPDLIRGDGSLKRAAIDAHDNALDAGYQVDTPGYFQYIEGVLGGGKPAPADNGGQPRQRAPMMAAPVERGAAPGGGGGGAGADGTFMVTPKMRRLAEEQGVPIKEWATNYLRLLREGRITPIT